MVTRPAGEFITSHGLHDREIIVLPPDRYEAWLDTTNPEWKATLSNLGETPWLEYIVSRYLSGRGADGPECIAPAA